MQVFRFELKALGWFTLLWSFGLAALTALYISVYPSFSLEANQLQKVFESLPPALRSGMSLDPTLMVSFLGFFTNVVHFVILGAGIMASIMGFQVFSRERRARTTDFLLSKPILRQSVFVQKYLAGIVQLAITTLVFGVVAYTVAKLVHAGDVDMAVFGRIDATFGFVQLWFFTVASMLAIVLRPRRSPSGPGLVLAAGLFLVGMVGGMIDAATVRWVSPFKYIDLAYVLQHRAFEVPYIWYGLLWVMVCFVVAGFVWTRRDIRAED